MYSTPSCANLHYCNPTLVNNKRDLSVEVQIVKTIVSFRSYDFLK